VRQRRSPAAIARRKRLYVLPWQMAVAGWFMRRLPRPLYVLFSHAPHNRAVASLGASAVLAAARPRADSAEHDRQRRFQLGKPVAGSSTLMVRMPIASRA